MDLVHKFFKIRFIVGYNPNSNAFNYMHKFFNEIVYLINICISFMLIGDINLPKFNWSNNTYSKLKQYETFANFM